MTLFRKEWILYWMVLLSADQTFKPIKRERNHEYWERQYRELQLRDQREAASLEAMHKLQADVLHTTWTSYQNLLRLTSQTTTTSHAYTSSRR